ncbi:ribonuclease H [Synechococcus sp. M16CYN]|uniref:ribonuclease H family protein n=1 Tax=Synechococcus sp. M16CYN TaxID=3103139 RepID=UPI003254D976
MADVRGRVVAAAADGACRGNPGPGGWGVLLRFEDGSVEEFGGYNPATTNNRMELQAALKLLERLRQLARHPDLRLRTDSRYLVDGLGSWIKGWKRKGWRTAAGSPVLNQDLWKALDAARLDDAQFTHVKGHSGDPDNERVDRIAVAFSHGYAPKLNFNDKVTVPALATELDMVSAQLHQSLTRLELADRVAERGCSITTAELEHLVGEPLKQLVTKDGSWEWRDWLIVPDQNGYWRLRRRNTNSGKS